MANILAANSKIDLVYAEDDGEAAGAIEALQAVNRLAGTKVIGLNGFKIGLKNIKEGKQTATFFTSFKAGGAQAVDMLVARLRTGKAPKNPCQSVSSVLVTKANVAQFIPKGEV
jgi:ribose transport system substrate-binding protein